MIFSETILFERRTMSKLNKGVTLLAQKTLFPNLSKKTDAANLVWKEKIHNYSENSHQSHRIKILRLEKRFHSTKNLKKL